MTRRSPLPFAAFLLLSTGQLASAHAVADGPSQPALFVDGYYEALFDWDPNQATYAGLHHRDDRMADLSEAAVARRIQSLKKSKEDGSLLVAGKPTDAEAIDVDLVRHAIDAELLDLTGIKEWRRNPMLYVGKPADSIDILMKRSFAKPADRLRSIIGRLGGVPRLLEAMKANIQHPPKEFTELALIVAKGTKKFIAEDVSTWAKAAAGDDQKLLSEFLGASSKATTSFDDAIRWLESDLAKRSDGGYAIGADGFIAKLAAEEMLDIPLERLIAIGEANLKKDQEAFRRTAAVLDPKLSAEKVLLKLTEDRPTPANLVGAARGTIERTRQFLIDKKIVTLPSEVRPTVTETPAFMRTGNFASMDTPGAFETNATEAFYYITPPETEWPVQRQDEHMRQFNRTQLDVITIHEAFPGHYVQFLYAKQYPTKTRKLYTCGTNVEGWAHYCEEMIIDEGYGNGNPEYRLAQLSEALLRDCRYLVGIHLHCHGWTVEQGKQFFIRQGFVEPETAFQESRRGTYNPTYLYYTLGKLQIKKLRDDMKAAQGAAFNLESFHNSFVRQGGLPIKVIRSLLLPDSRQPTL